MGGKKTIIITNTAIILIFIILATIAAVFCILTGCGIDFGGDQTGESGEFEDYQKNIVVSKAKKDSIPPLEFPRYVSVDDAKKYMDNGDIVFLYTDGSSSWIFPRKIMVWHEIVNDKFNEKPLSITYCPLTGSVIGYVRNTGGEETTFGTSGRLLNSNLVLYDRLTQSLWSQIMGTAVSGKLAGEELKIVPVIWTNWGDASFEYPESLVLSDQTGFLRDYQKDPYGSYDDPASYYVSGDPLFPLMSYNYDLPFKEVVVAIKSENRTYTIRKSDVVKNRVVNGGLPEFLFVAIYDERLDAVRVFDRDFDGQIHDFEYADNKIISTGLNYTWTADGFLESKVSLVSNQKRLSPVDSFEVMWFSWSAFYPETIITGNT
ncbi:DUF3179 domain-containing protein [Methanoplanus sp. FWC-SCC4]|uniref:DUF3179 domain-containing protein n=1 Tax=Methanochimaera problematica TaxID=2609417 RepID=A0AA97I2W9_9EURY|nr:DUF3179 domain-containing protein [Methanoplanus sp. FWC-SCC4]WOF16740.1 DUF3179 domain-containing protein [Methanoplanus sp. FWC-SCC4]